jgi:hypothetical protein
MSRWLHAAVARMGALTHWRDTPENRAKADADFAMRTAANDAQIPPMATRAMTYGRAMLSEFWQAPPNENEIALRLKICGQCEHFEAATESELMGFCKSCGCKGKTQSVSLARKVKIKYPTCPLKRWTMPLDPTASPSSASPQAE